MSPSHYENLIREEALKALPATDPAHDLLHLGRVVRMAKKICEKEKADFEVVVPAAWLHDFVVYPKDSPLRKVSSLHAAEKAEKFLRQINYPKEKIGKISHAILAHSFSANIQAETIEAQVVQDADRLDGLGAIGLARCFVTAGLMNRSLYSAVDPFCEHRQPDDTQYTIDHFYKKLFKVADQLKTESGRQIGLQRIQLMKNYLDSLNQEIRPGINEPY